ncbi:glycosyltransferase [Rhodococcus sp. G-MC3]|uniref:glycosyltransferase n=1 Tax=Rhodococcus sp. G-MC3 TaxID=3046209 RepID=UPI0024B912EA|nr:glycosyltransferase [Rhodococcus sp. G-MC3]MDJ0392870.1 glycosyltransferase [Rhodococcus sp. G-MC3]
MIGYYAHHQGSGHVNRATSIAAAVREPLTVLSSRPRPGSSDVAWVELPLDIDDDVVDYVDPTAGGIVHWAPTGVGGLTDRMAAIAAWIVAERPRLFVVDVSVEVALFVRLLGVDVVVVAMPGERDDEPHRLAYRLATAIIAPWSDSVYDPEWLHPYAESTTYVGAISRFDGRARQPIPGAAEILVLGGAGGTSLTTTDVEHAASANSGYRWKAAGIDRASWVDDIWPLLCSASVVVTHAGQNAIADIAAARVPAIVIAQSRPFAEQDATARALHRAGAAVVTTEWPDPGQWQPLLHSAAELDLDAWTQLRQPGAATRVAELLDSIVAR